MKSIDRAVSGKIDSTDKAAAVIVDIAQAYEDNAEHFPLPVAVSESVGADNAFSCEVSFPDTAEGLGGQVRSRVKYQVEFANDSGEMLCSRDSKKEVGRTDEWFVSYFATTWASRNSDADEVYDRAEEDMRALLALVGGKGEKQI